MSALTTSQPTVNKPPFTRETALRKVRAAEDAWNSRDPQRVSLAYSEDSEWRNRDRFLRGRNQIREFLTWFFGAVDDLEFTIIRQIAHADGWVMNERNDRLDFGGKVVNLPIMGVFEFRGELISAWRDYFDMALLDALGTEVSVPR